MADLTVGSGGTYTTIAAAVAAATSGDRVLVLDTHSESIAATTTITLSTTTFPPYNPLPIICVDSFSTPALSVGGGYNWTSNSNLILNGHYIIYGVYFLYTGAGGNTNPGLTLGTATSSAAIKLINVRVSTTSTSSLTRPIKLGVTAGATGNDSYRIELIGCELQLGAATQFINIGAGNHFIDDLTLTGAITPNNLFSGTASTGVSNLSLRNSDLSAFAIGSLMDGSALGQTKLFVNDVKLHATTLSQIFGTGTIDAFNELTAVNVASGDSSVSFEYIGGAGKVSTDTTVYATTSPMQDGGVSVSRKMTSSANASVSVPLQTELLLPVDNDASITPYVEILVGADGAAALTNLQCWIDVQALTTDGTAIGSTYTTYPGFLDSSTTLPAGTTAYTGDGFTTERTHKIQLGSAITARQDGFVKITVNFAVSSSVIYVGTYGG